MVSTEHFTVAILQARMSSSRLPGKVMMPVNGVPMIHRQIERIRQATTISELIVATSTDPSDDILVEYLRTNGVRVFRGALDDVLSRFLEIEIEVQPTTIIRLTGDCPLVMPELIDKMVIRFYESNVDYLSNTLEPTYPDGLDIEIIKASAMRKLSRIELSEAEREHVTLGIYRRPSVFTLENFRGDQDLNQNRWTVDYLEDLHFVRQVFMAFIGREAVFSLEDTIIFLNSKQGLKSEISSDRRNEKLGDLMPKSNSGVIRYSESVSQLVRAEQTIPLGSQTFSKSRTQYPVGISPLYVTKAKGAKIWDVDGNSYIDLVSSLASITFGYGDREISRAVKKQLRLGVSLSLPTKLESEVAELIVEMVPSAEMVRFGKNGTDAISAAVRLARAFTGRDHILVCGYHGWQDWYIGSTTRDKGVPESVSALTHKFEYNNIESLKALLNSLENKVAAVIMEPMNSTYPKPGFLEDVLFFAHEAGALLVFDETITGFRYARGGAQEIFGVIPDLSTFGKGIANGFPLSAVVGRRDVMMEMEEIFFSGTFGGELLSLTAAKVVLQRHLAEDVCGKLDLAGQSLSHQTEQAIIEHSLEAEIKISGHPSWRFINWNPTETYSVDEIKTYFMQEVFKRGLLVLSTHNITLAHTPKIISEIVDVYSAALSELHRVIEAQTLRQELRAEPLKPLFRVR